MFDRPTIFISSSVQTLRAASALGAQLEAHAEVRFWQASSFVPGATSMEALASQFADADLVVAFVGADDLSGGNAPRDNLLLELGMAMGLLGRDRVLVAAEPGVGLPSALADHHIITSELHDPLALEALAGRVMSRLSAVGARPGVARGSVTAFFSYANADRDFAEQLASDLTRAGISCWLDRDHLATGEHWSERIGEASTGSDRVLAVLSPASVRSPWVEREVELAQSRESRTGRTILFPVAVDPSVLRPEAPWAELLAKTRDIADFTNWRDARAYGRSLRRLLQGLSISADRST